MAVNIEDEETRIFLLSGIAVFTDKIRRLISMTKVGRLFEEEKENYAAKKVAEVALNLLKNGMGVEAVASVCEMSVEEVKKIYESILIKL